MSLTQPAIAVNDRIAATTAPAHNANTTAAGCVRGPSSYRSFVLSGPATRHTWSTYVRFAA